jgi:hypothetical protein
MQVSKLGENHQIGLWHFRGADLRWLAYRENTMLLQCEIQDAEAIGDAGAASWLRANTIESLIELNESCLALFAEQASAGGDSALLGQFSGHWRLLDAAGRRRAASCHYLLFDAGFADARRWQYPTPETDSRRGGAFFTVPGTAALVQGVLLFGWHLARCQRTAAQLLLGMPASSVTLIARCTLGQVRALAAGHPEWLQPRWLRHPRVWRGILTAAGGDDPSDLTRAHLRGQTLLAADMRGQPAEPVRLAPATAVRRGPVQAPASPRGVVPRPSPYPWPYKAG